MALKNKFVPLLKKGIQKILDLSKIVEYESDLSTYYTDRSLVDKEYVDKNLYLPVTTITSDYTALITDKIIEIDAISNSVTLTLPTLTASDDGKQFIIDVYNADNAVTLLGPNGLNETLILNETRTYVWYNHRNSYRRIN